MPNRIRDDLLIVDKESFPYIYEENVSIQLIDGLVRCNVYRPKSAGPFPVLVSYGPYGKDVPYDVFSPRSWVDMNPSQKSKHSAFETPDPRYWTENGYVVVRADEIGTGQSPGVLDTKSKTTADAFFQIIEWAAVQPWSTGKVGLLGISYFAGTQWRVAARRPKGLACIVPYEGMADYYRDRCRPGGILALEFLRKWFEHNIASNQYGPPGKAAESWGSDTIDGDLSEDELRQNRRDQAVDNAAHQFRDKEYYASRDYNLELINVPLLSVGNWGSICCHLRGNIQGFVLAQSTHKFLRMIVGRHDAPFYTDEELEVQKSFLSAFLKDDDYDGWTKGNKPPVDLILRKGNIGHANPDAPKLFKRRSENEWPIARTQYTKYFLTPDKRLATEGPALGAKPHSIVSFPALGTHHLHTGHIVAHLNVSVTPHIAGPVPKDIDLFLTLRHFGADGEQIFYTGLMGDPAPLCKGWLRVSLRKINKEHPHHRDYLPHRDYFAGDVLPVIPGEVYPVYIEIWPTNVVVQPGERIVLEVGSGDSQGCGFFTHESEERTYDRLGGDNHIHLSERYENWLSLPLIPQT
ncbi:Alpha/Beta hydrolase protein [Aspergillus karnatakaensis]|uniref:CocE/NonD family hydrolase n=1 Tax=Aspergillus karnatakaensis TaxID=1810916 RepID=UPI003CCE5321